MNPGGFKSFPIFLWLILGSVGLWSAEKNSNSAFSEIKHIPEQPRAGEAVTISAKVSAPAKTATLAASSAASGSVADDTAPPSDLLPHRGLG